MVFKMPWIDLRVMEQSHFQCHYLYVRNYILIRRKVYANLILGGSMWFLKQNSFRGFMGKRVLFLFVCCCFNFVPTREKIQEFWRMPRMLPHLS